MNKTILAALLALALPAVAGAQPVDITGTWNLTVVADQTIPATLTVTKAGEKLAGTVVGPQGEMPLDVELKDKAVTLTLYVQTQNGPMTVVFSGTVEGDQMSGTADMAGRGTASWNASRAAAQNPPKDPPKQEKPAPTMTGTWAFEVQHSAGTSTPTVTITQTDGKLAGKYLSTYGEYELTGSIKGTEFTFSVVIGTEQTVTVVYTGTLDGDTVKGNMTMGEMGEGTFTGKRK